ncbi:hypothetical protein NDU88_008769 [Pleurodeles waltl]|uniref:Uncharacterized protein n=1 Tax=Pleurodeles waltl TaxID=8319 RepID=A0AAV7QTR0_PLEWA|nr:hypothetical protein NDU88_008769 [Pleurodeles waltl]
MTESQINGLQAVIKRLEKQVQDLTKKQAKVVAKLEDQEVDLRLQTQALIGVGKRLQIETLEKEVRALEAQLPGSSLKELCRQLLVKHVGCVIWLRTRPGNMPKRHREDYISEAKRANC